MLKPGRQVWVDFFVPASDPLWSDDVSQAVGWVGEMWSSVVAQFVAELPAVFSGRLVADGWGRLVCFAGTGAGEVLVAGRKVVGVSQRRNRSRARIQTMARLGAGPGSAAEANSHRGGSAGRRDGFDELDFLALTPVERTAGRAALQSRGGFLSADVVTVTEALLNALTAQD